MGEPSFLEELQRRKVFRVGLVYGATAFVLIQVADLVYRAVGIPEWAFSLTVILLLLGFPVALVLAWAFEVTPEGVRRAPGRGEAPGHGASGWLDGRTALLVGGLLLVGLGLGAGWFLGSDPGDDAAGADAPEVTEASVAALPFANLSPDEDDRYFADGVHEEILTRLARVEPLKVISRTSVMSYRDTDKNLREIGRELGVRYVLEGSVRRVGERVRVSAQLIDASTDAHVWADTYDRSVSDVLAIQAEVASHIAEALSAELSPEERERIANLPTESEEAYDLYLRASSLGWRGQGANREEQGRLWRQAVGLLDRAVEIDPAFALAWAGLAEWNVELFWFGHDRTEERRDRAGRAATRAVELAPELGEAHYAQGLYHYHGHRDYRPALASARRALLTLPGDAQVVGLVAFVLRRMGRYEEAMENLKRAYEIDPRNVTWAWEIAGTATAIRSPLPEVRRWCERAIQLEPEYAGPYVVLARLAVARQGDLERARRELDRIPAGEPRSGPAVRAARYWLEVLSRDYEAALEVLDDVGDEVLDMQDDVVAVDYLRGLALHLRGRRAEAREAFGRALPVLEARDAANPGYYGILHNLAVVRAALGRREGAEAAMGRARALLPVERDHYVGPLILEKEAVMRVWLGDRDRALDLLESLSTRRYSESSLMSPAILRLDPFWDPIRDDPRFRELTRGAPVPEREAVGT